jgi:hypothetical protein
MLVFDNKPITKHVGDTGDYRLCSRIHYRRMGEEAFIFKDWQMIIIQEYSKLANYYSIEEHVNVIFPCHILSSNQKGWSIPQIK